MPRPTPKERAPVKMKRSPLCFLPDEELADLFVTMDSTLAESLEVGKILPLESVLLMSNVSESSV
jgi:hypothetical protein